MLFEVCGRQSDIGFNDDPGPPNAFMQYHAASCAAFKNYATPANGFDAKEAAIWPVGTHIGAPARSSGADLALRENCERQSSSKAVTAALKLRCVGTIGGPATAAT